MHEPVTLRPEAAARIAELRRLDAVQRAIADADEASVDRWAVAWEAVEAACHRALAMPVRDWSDLAVLAVVADIGAAGDHVEQVEFGEDAIEALIRGTLHVAGLPGRQLPPVAVVRQERPIAERDMTQHSAFEKAHAAVVAAVEAREFAHRGSPDGEATVDAANGHYWNAQRALCDLVANESGAAGPDEARALIGLVRDYLVRHDIADADDIPIAYLDAAARALSEGHAAIVEADNQPATFLLARSADDAGTHG